MERAIEVMRDSIDEPREDGKPQPKVGAVLYKADGKIQTACRGELRDGDHAEFTLMERKNRHNKLDGSILLTTLEPCARGARTENKMSCAERIVLSRIKQVWIGIQDPDPTVDRKGIDFLQKHGVEVQMFDRDLQELIQAENREFISGALERAAAKKEKPMDVVLSELERATETAHIQDFSNEALELYRELAQIKDPVGSNEFNRRLIQQGLLKEQEGRLIPTGFGLLLFGKEPRIAMPQAGLLATIHYPDGTEETRNFESPAVLIPGEVEKWIKDKLPNVIDRSEMRRQEIPPLSFEMVREAVVNALIHRDYDIRQAKCQLVITANTITVKSPGAPVKPITLEQLQAFKAPMLSRNPEMHYVFARMEMAEERGLGIKSLRNRAEDLGLPLPKYSFEDPYLVLTLFRSREAAKRELEPNVRASLNNSEQDGWQWLATKGNAKSSEYAAAMGLDDRTARRHLNKFLKLDLVRRIASGPATEYEVI
jgi:ATP-dependent DNA helicase RecG